MRTWTRAKISTLCGKCRAVIAVNEPLLTITRSGQAWRLVRCSLYACAEESVPADLSAPVATHLESRQPVAIGMERVGAVRSSALASVADGDPRLPSGDRE